MSTDESGGGGGGGGLNKLKRQQQQYQRTIAQTRGRLLMPPISTLCAAALEMPRLPQTTLCLLCPEAWSFCSAGGFIKQSEDAIDACEC